MITPHTSDYDEVLTMVRRLSRREQVEIIRELIADFAPNDPETLPYEDDNPLTPEEIQVLMNAERLSPQQVIDMGLTGTWARYGIRDGGEWADEQRRKRAEKSQW